MTIAGFMVDISNPETYNYTGTTVIPEQYHSLPRCSAFYLGGNTPHVWTLAQVHAQTNRYKLPIWVYGAGEHAATEAADYVTRLHAYKVPAGSRVALDMETSVDSAFVSVFIKVVEEAGFKVAVYGSLSSVKSNPVGAGGYWTASWNGFAHIDSGAWATQYANSAMTGHPFDISAVSSFESLWDTAAPLPPAPPPVVSSILLKMQYSSDRGKTWHDITLTPNILT